MAGEVRCDDVFLQLFASDASIYENQAAGRRAAAIDGRRGGLRALRGRKAHPDPCPRRGTGVAGESLGPGLVLDFSAHLRRVVRRRRRRVRVQPGVVLRAANEQLRRQGGFSGPIRPPVPSPPSAACCAIDAAGSRWLKYGSTRRHVESLQVVLADGQVLELGREPLADGPAASGLPPASGNWSTGWPRCRPDNAELIRRQSAQLSAGDHCGYRLAVVLADGIHRRGPAAGGSEGTLALVTEATLGHRAAAAAIAAWLCCSSTAWRRRPARARIWPGISPRPAT